MKKIKLFNKWYWLDVKKFEANVLAPLVLLLFLLAYLLVSNMDFQTISYIKEVTP